MCPMVNNVYRVYVFSIVCGFSTAMYCRVVSKTPLQYIARLNHFHIQYRRFVLQGRIAIRPAIQSSQVLNDLPKSN